MKPMLFAIAAPLLLLSEAAVAQTQPQTQPWEGPFETIAAAGYTYGVESGLSPQTETEEFNCAVMWDVWNVAYAGNVLTPELERTLPSAMSRGSTTTSRDEWREAVARNQGTTPMLAMIKIIEPTRERTSKQDRLMAGLRGDKTTLFQVSMSLGTCSNPPRPGLESLK